MPLMPSFAPPNVDRLEKTHNVRALLRAARSQRWSETGVVLPAVDALARLRDSHAATPLLAALSPTLLRSTQPAFPP